MRLAPGIPVLRPSGRALSYQFGSISCSPSGGCQTASAVASDVSSSHVGRGLAPATVSPFLLDAGALGALGVQSLYINRTPRTGELRSAPSWPDDWHRVAGKRALALGGARSQGHNTGLRGIAPRSGFPLAAERTLYSERMIREYSPRVGLRFGFPLAAAAPPLLGASDTRIRTTPPCNTLPEDNTKESTLHKVLTSTPWVQSL